MWGGRLGLYRAVVRFLGSQALFAVLIGVTVSVALLLALDFFTLHTNVPATAFGVYWALALLYVGGGRLFVRSLFTMRRAGTERVVIYGAGAAGAQLANTLVAGGRYFPATSPESLANVYENIDQLEKSRVGRLQFAAYDELAWYFLAAAIGFLALELLANATVWRRAL